MGTSAQASTVGSPIISNHNEAVCGAAFADADAQIGLHGAGALGYAGGAVGVAAAPAVVAQRVATAPHCQTTYDTITTQQCHTVSEQQCHEEITTIVDTTTIEDCQDITEQVCTQSSVSVAHSSNVVGRTSGVAGVAVAPAAAVGVAGGVQAVGYGAGLINHRIAKREADAEPEADADAYYGAGYGAAPVATSAPNCHAETRRVCNPRTVETPRQISNPA